MRGMVDPSTHSVNNDTLRTTTTEDVRRARLTVINHLGSGAESREVLEMLGIGADFPARWMGPIVGLDKPRYAR